jgi:hypothetical protein
MGWAKTRIVAVVAVWLVVGCGVSLAGGFGAYEVLSQSEDEITFSVKLPRFDLDTLIYEGVEYVRPWAMGLVPFGEEGAPDLPVFSVLLAVPPGAEVELVSISRTGGGSMEGVRIAPVPRIEAVGEDGGRFPVYVYAEDGELYRSTSYLPQNGAWLEDRGTLRHQNVVRVVISPFRYAPLESRLSFADEVTVKVAFVGGEVLRGGTIPEDSWEGVYRGALLNYEQGKKWRRRPQAQMLERTAVENERLKVLVDKTGIHRIGYDSMASLRFPADVSVDEVMVYRDDFEEGSPDPVRVVESAIEIDDNDQNGILSPGDTISFFGLDFYDQFGRRGNEDYFFDKNVYWVSYADGEHSRIQPRNGWRDSASPVTPSHFTDLVHEEEDFEFVNYPPNADTDLYTWKRYAGTFDFTLPGVDSMMPASLVANFVSFYSDPTGKVTRGLVGVYVGSCTTAQTKVATLNIALPSEDRRTIPVSPGLLCSYGNTFRFESELPSTYTPGHQLDWFEVVYARKYQAHQDMLVFDDGGVTGEVEYRITGFSKSDISVYDVTDSIAPVRIEIDPGQVTEEDGAFTLTFRDSISETKKYFALCSSCAWRPDPEDLSLAAPPVLRDVTGDYLIVSHPDFVGGLDPLVARRQANGFSVVVATTEEVYDDFGNGAKSDVAIQRFAEYAFFNGDAQFLLLVGDANTDRRGVLLDPPGSGIASDMDYVPSHNIILKDGSVVNKEIRPSENWFGKMGGPGDPYPDMYVGRFPVDDTGELDAMITKVETFEDYSGTDQWKKRLLFIADDFYRSPERISMRDSLCALSGDPSFEKACDSVSVIVKDYSVAPVDTVKYYLRRCTRNHEPDRRAHNLCVGLYSAQIYTRSNCTPDVIALLNSGALLVNFQGHSNHYQLTHETLIRDDFYYDDVEDLSNSSSPFMFFGLGCWMSDFQRQSETATFIGEAIAEKFIKNADGGACLSFASACAEYISENEEFNPFLLRALFTHLQGRDPQGNPIAARIIAGEAMVTSLLRFGRTSFADKHILLGDPGMVVDLGPPAVAIMANGVPVGDSYVYTGADTVVVVADIKDEEAIMSIDLSLVDDEVTPISPDSYTEIALIDTGFTRSRHYQVLYAHLPLLGDYAIEVQGEDYVGKVGTGEIRIQTGSAVFSKDGVELEEGDPLVFGQRLEIEIARPESVAQGDIQAYVDTVHASEFDEYSLEMLDEEGKQWKVSFIPTLESGEHTVTVNVGVLSASRDFEYVPARVRVLADDQELLENDYVSSLAEFQVVVEAGTGIKPGDLGIDLDGDEVPAEFKADSDSVILRASFEVDLEPGEHEIRVRVFDVWVSKIFRVSDKLSLTDVSVFPNPFSGETYFFYTLSQNAAEVTLGIYTVSGRLIYESDMPTGTGYNQYRWDGRDLASDRVANGTYLYRIVAKAGSRERESAGWVVKIE